MIDLNSFRFHGPILALLLISATTAVHATPYGPGFTWNRISDYQAGTTIGSTTGNPNPDQNGSPAWSYEYYQGWGNWDSGTLLPWNGWRWANSYGNISKWDQNNHFLNDASFTRTPLIRWINPTNETIDINLGGWLKLFWLGRDWTGSGWSSYLVSGVKDVNLVMGYYDASANMTTSYLIDQTIYYPETTEVKCGIGHGGWGNCVKTVVDLDFDLTMDAGDSIFWTSQAVSPYTNDWKANRWLTLNDTKLTITVQDPLVTGFSATVPEPSTLLLTSLLLPGLFFIQKGKKAFSAVDSS